MSEVDAGRTSREVGFGELWQGSRELLDPRSGLSVGRARVTSHWGELVQVPVSLPQFSDPVTVLVTLPDISRWSDAIVVPNESGLVTAENGSLTKAEKVARTLISTWEANKLGCTIRIERNIPIGVGGGSSSADCTATARATQQMLGLFSPAVSDLDILKMVFGAEGPCDPLPLLGWGVPVLWASRAGQLIKVYERPLPSLHALGFVLDVGRVVSTDALASAERQNPAGANEVQQAAEVLRLFERGVATGSAATVVGAAMLSGSLCNEHRCHIDGWDIATRLSEKVQALGASRSHSGTALALLWSADDHDLNAKISDARRLLNDLHATEIHEFGTDGPRMRWRTQ